MFRSKLVPILMLVVAGGAVAFNWNYYHELLGGGSVVPPAATPQHLEVPDHRPDASAGGNAVPNPALDPATESVECTPPPIEAGIAARLGAAPASEPEPPPDRDPAPGAELVTVDAGPAKAQPSSLVPVMERLLSLIGGAAVERMAPERRVTPFHSDGEVISGMTLEKLLAEAESIRNNRQRKSEESGDGAGTGSGPKGEAGTAATAAPAPIPAAAPEAMIESAMLTCILRGKGYGLCVLGGRKMRTGDAWPGTTFKVTDITEREVVLSDGTLKIRKELAALSTGKGAASATPPIPVPETGNEGGS